MKYISYMRILFGGCIISVGIVAYQQDISGVIMLSSLAILWLIIIMGENDK